MTWCADRTARLLLSLVLLQALPAAAASGWNDPALLDELKRLTAADGVPAVGLVILAEGRPALVTAWGRTGNPERPIADADTPFRVGSITKTFTALAALAVVQEGRLSLTEPLPDAVARHLVNPWGDSHPLRLVELLELTAGLSDLSRVEWDNQDPSPLTLVQALALAPEHRRALWPPGLRYSYTNAAPGLTALAIEQATGAPFEAVLHDRVLEPLGMAQATLLKNAYLDANLPRGFKADGVTEIPYWHMTFRAFGALSATPREMSRFLTMLLNGGRLDGREVVPRATVRRLLSPTSTLAARAGLGIGYGLGIYGRVRDGFVFHGHGGDGDGFLSRYGLLLDRGRGYFIVINADYPAALARMRRAVERALTRDLSAPAPPPAITVAPDILRAFSGHYYPSTVRFRVADWQAGRLPCARLDANTEGLMFSRGRQRTQLVPVSGALFRRPDDPLATVALIDGPQGLEMQGELGNYIRVGAPDSGAFIGTCDSQ